VLGPLAFIVFINDIDDLTRLITIMNKFADDTKLGNIVTSQSDIDDLQKCIDDLVSWAEAWGMQFNVKKCKVMHIGRNNPKAQYTMNGTVLESTDEERDIGVKVHKSLRPSKQCTESARRANAVLGQISRAFHYRNKYTFIDLYKQYVRPHLEFAVPAWSPWTQGDREVLEKVQRRAVRMVSGLRGTTYEEKLAEIGILTLEERRLQYDLVQTFKIIRGFDKVDLTTWFTLVGDNPARITRDTSDPLNIVRQVVRTEIRRHFFSNRVIDHWNSLPSEIKLSSSVHSFKFHITNMLLKNL
jgi:ribonucleases P/MRP protein subunit RPP40